MHKHRGGATSEDLITACKLNKKKEVARILADQTIDVNACDERSGLAPIHIAAKNNFFKILELLLADPRVDINAPQCSDTRDTALHYAVRWGSYDARTFVMLVNDPRINVNVVDSAGMTPLLIAAILEKHSYYYVYNLLSFPNIKINTLNIYGFSPLNFAINQDNADTVALLASDQRTDIYLPYKGQSPLLYAAYTLNRPECVAALLTRPGIDITKGIVGSSADNYPPLFGAITKKRVDVCKVFAEFPGIDPNYVEPKTGDTALIYAARASSEPIMRIIADIPGIDPNIRNKEGMTALMYAVKVGTVNDVKILLDLPSTDPNLPLPGGAATLIQYSAENKDINVLKALLAVSRVKVINSDGWYILHAVAKTPSGNVEMVADPIKSVDVNAVIPGKQSLLHTAIASGNVDMVRVLLEHGANVNSKNLQNQTPLYVAAIKGRAKIVELLLADATLTIDAATMESIGNGEIVKPIADLIVAKADAGALSKLMWQGFTRGDASKFETIFDITPPREGGRPPAENWSSCPICLKYVARIDGCKYMTHNCTELRGFYHKELYNLYKNERDYVSWCSVCGRICDGHRHYLLISSAATERPELAEFTRGADIHGSTCAAEGGGNLEEKLMRFRKLRETGRLLNNEIGKITKMDAFMRLVEGAWNAPVYAGNTERALIANILAKKRWNIPEANFPLNVVANAAAPAPAPAANVVRSPENVAALTPIVHEKGFNLVGMEDDVPVIQFRHRRANGTVNMHEGEYIGVGTFRDFVKGQNAAFGLPAFGFCWNYPECNARLYPDEVKRFVEPEVYEEYKTKFNKKFGA
jgi:ankyrin repeat protein